MGTESRNTVATRGQVGDEEPEPSKNGGFWRFWLSLPGLITAIASLVGALAALAALFVHQNQQLTQRTEALEQATSRPQPTVTVTETVTATPDSPNGFGSNVSDPGSGSTLPGGSRYLADLSPVGGSMSTSAEAAVLSNRSYTRSVLMFCDDGDLIYNTSGWNKLTATLGVADNASDANGAIADVAFYDQDDRQIGKQIAVSIAHPTTVTFDMSGVVQTKITCSGRDRITDEARWFYVTLGDAALTP